MIILLESKINASNGWNAILLVNLIRNHWDLNYQGRGYYWTVYEQDMDEATKFCRSGYLEVIQNMTAARKIDRLRAVNAYRWYYRCMDILDAWFWIYNLNFFILLHFKIILCNYCFDFSVILCVQSINKARHFKYCFFNTTLLKFL